QGVHGRVGEHELAAGRHVDPQFGGLDRDVLRAHQLGGADPQAGRGAVHRDGGDRGRAGDLDARGSPVDRAAVDHGVRGAEPDRAVRDLVGGQVGDRDVLGTGRGDDPVATTVDGHAGERDVRRAALDPHAGLGVGDLRVVDLDLLAADVHPGDPGALDGGVLQLQVPGALLDDHAPASAARADVVEHDAGAADVGEDADRLVGGAEVGDRDVLDLVEPQATRLVGLGGDAADAGALLHRHDQAVLLVAVRGEPGDLTVGVLPADEHAVGAVALGPEVGHAGALVAVEDDAVVLRLDDGDAVEGHVVGLGDLHADVVALQRGVHEGPGAVRVEADRRLGGLGLVLGRAHVGDGDVGGVDLAAGRRLDERAADRVERQWLALPVDPVERRVLQRQPAAAGVDRARVRHLGAAEQPDGGDVGDLEVDARRQHDRRVHRGGVAVDGDPVARHHVVEGLQGERARPPRLERGEPPPVADLAPVGADGDHLVRPAALVPRRAGPRRPLGRLGGFLALPLELLEPPFLGLARGLGRLLRRLLRGLALRFPPALLLEFFLGRAGGAGPQRRPVGVGATGVAGAAPVVPAVVAAVVPAVVAAVVPPVVPPVVVAGVGATAVVVAGGGATAAAAAAAGRLRRRRHDPRGGGGRRGGGGGGERERADGEARHDDAGEPTGVRTGAGHAALPTPTARIGM